MKQRKAGELRDEIHDRWLEERLDRALAHAPEVTAPADFAARVMAALPPEHATTERAGYGRRALLWCAGLLCLTMLLLLAGVTREPFWLQTLLAVELVVISLGAGTWRRVVRWPV